MIYQDPSGRQSFGRDDEANPKAPEIGEQRNEQFSEHLMWEEGNGSRIPVMKELLARPHWESHQGNKPVWNLCNSKIYIV